MNPIISRNLTPLPYKGREAEKLLLVGMGVSKPLPAPLPNPLLKGEGKGITFNTGEVWRGVYLYIKNFSNILLVISNYSTRFFLLSLF
jgi:hypothetical protein